MPSVKPGARALNLIPTIPYLNVMPSAELGARALNLIPTTPHLNALPSSKYAALSYARSLLNLLASAKLGA